jgi:hypothetical protein
MRLAVVQISHDPITATSWEEVPGGGLVREIQNPTPGLLGARAAHTRARAVSDFCAPVSITIK